MAIGGSWWASQSLGPPYKTPMFGQPPFDYSSGSTGYGSAGSFGSASGGSAE